MMNLFCFSLEGSMDNLYEVVQQGQSPAYIPSRSCSRSCSPAVLLDDSTKWRGSGRSFSMEVSQTQGTNATKKKRRTHVSKSSSDYEALADNIGCNTALLQTARSREDLAPYVNIQNEELGKTKHRIEAKGYKGGRQSGTKKNEKALPSQSVFANGTTTEPRSKPAVKRGQKGGKKTNTKNTKEGTKKSHNPTVHSPTLLMIPTVGAPYLDVPYKPDRIPYTGKASTLPSQENTTPGRGIDMRLLPGGATPTHNYHQRWSNLAESSPAWGDTHAQHTCRRPLTEYRVYSHDFTMLRGKDWEGKEHQATASDSGFRLDSKADFLPVVPRSITDMDLTDRSTSFGRFEGLRHQPSPVKPEENGTTGAAEDGGSMDLLKPTGLSKKMKAISLTMRRKMAKKHAKSFSEELGDETDRDPDGETDCGLPGEKGSAKTTNSLESLNSGQSSSSGVTSDANGSSLRDSLRLEVDGPCQIQFCGRARVHTDFVPSPYDTDSLKLKVGDIINVISKPPMGIWTGMLNNKVGNFKFIYVDVVVEKQEEEAPKIRQQKLCQRPRPKTLLELLEKLNLEEYASALLLNGYQSVEDLLHLQEKHLIELNVKDPEHRQRLLTAANIHYTGDDVRETEEHISSQTLQEEDSDCPRDSGCFIPAECKEDGDHLGDTVNTDT